MKSNFVTRTISVAVFLLVTFYFGARVLSYFLDPLTTTAAYRYRGEEGATVSGYLIREETVLDNVDSDMVYQPREEGEKISKGGRVAVIYHNAQALEAARQLEDLEAQLYQLEYAGSLSSGAQAARRLDADIWEDALKLRSLVVRGDLGDACVQAGTIRSLVVRRDFAYSGKTGLAEQEAALRAQINSLTVTANSGRSFITAGRSGHWSSLVDGYETVLTPAILETLTPSVLDSIAPQAGLRSNVGKLVTDETWYFAADLTETEAAALRVGRTVSIRFASGLDRVFEMTVQAISPAEDGRRTVILRSDRFLSLVTLLRHQTAQIIFQTYSGIRVPKNALRVVTREFYDKDKDAQVEVRYTGVYCRLARQAYLKPVTVIYEGEDYYLVEPDETVLARYAQAQQSSRTLRPGDEVIITARDLFDGKVVS